MQNAVCVTAVSCAMKNGPFPWASHLLHPYCVCPFSRYSILPVWLLLWLNWHDQHCHTSYRPQNNAGTLAIYGAEHLARLTTVLVLRLAQIFRWHHVLADSLPSDTMKEQKTKSMSWTPYSIDWQCKLSQAHRKVDILLGYRHLEWRTEGQFYVCSSFISMFCYTL